MSRARRAGPARDVPCVYACLSLVQALLLLRAGSAFDAYQAARREAPAPPHEEDALLAGAS